MKKTMPGGLIGRTISTAREAQISQVPLYAANASYFLILSVFPSLLLIIALLRATPLEITDLLSALDGVLPDALMPFAERLILSTYDSISSTIVSISLAAALWSASKGVYGVLRGLNVIYGVREDRGYIYTRGISVFYTFLFLLVLLLTLVLHVFGQTILNWIPPTENPLLLFLSSIIDLRFFLLLGLQTLLFTAIFMVLPNRRNRMLPSLPGALLASFGWLIFSDLFSIYVEHFNRYATLYGSIYAVALSMLWLYSCMFIVFCGGVLNRFLVLWKNP